MWREMLIPRLETERLIIRPLVIDDLDSCHQLFADVGATIDPGTGRDDSLELRRNWLEWTIGSYEQLARLMQPPYGERLVALKDSGRFVGLVGLAPLLKPFAQLAYFGQVESPAFSAEVGLFWAITPALQRKGFASEAARALVNYAFQTLKLGRVIANTEYDNPASIGVMRRLGMHIERNPYPDPEWFQITGILEARGTRHPH
jgi:RimJ/RimL family protein N-acetyltransferase